MESKKRDYQTHKASAGAGYGPQNNSIGVGHVLPLEVIDKCTNRKITILMKNHTEFFGTLTGFDDSTMTMILQEVKEFKYNGKERELVKEMPSILLNGAHICLMIPGDDEIGPKAVAVDS